MNGFSGGPKLRIPFNAIRLASRPHGSTGVFLLLITMQFAYWGVVLGAQQSTSAIPQIVEAIQNP